MMEKPEKRFRCSLASAPSCQAEESVLHASSFSLSFCLTVLVSQQAGLTAMIRPNAALWTREARVRAVYFHHSMLIPQMGSGFSSVLLVDSYVSPLQSHLLKARGGHHRGKARRPSVRPRPIGVWQQCAPDWQASKTASCQDSACR